MIFFAGFSAALKAIVENVGQKAALKDAKKGARGAVLE